MAPSPTPEPRDRYGCRVTWWSCLVGRTVRSLQRDGSPCGVFSLGRDGSGGTGVRARSLAHRTSFPLGGSGRARLSRLPSATTLLATRRHSWMVILTVWRCRHWAFPLRATSSHRPGLLPLAGRVAARTQRAVNAPLNVSCLIPFYKGQECGVYPRTGKGVQ